MDSFHESFKKNQSMKYKVSLRYIYTEQKWTRMPFFFIFVTLLSLLNQYKRTLNFKDTMIQAM